MKSQKNDSHTFWSGYALGMLGGSLLIYAFATKKGRDTIGKILEHTDTVENNIEDILELIQKKFSPLKTSAK
ncbi:hypothetical protein CO051_06875 [Candidatus Roizmanbacteria bacterium CG_4_9_14_0_2_um_filter_39_13]|uniref:Uncharacterized protein n=2 Tax=Candidatus Roizmaniibacteriota TaxID=1752723 RepID=A0A2M8EWF0_9BACT|nr:MAG: hypothetical protein CO051_06875 [Candidatus Roizmanbacteria bacterium CG_4_9_14_0_2_um_filter_39_13]PJE62035.1 MAG: hypothetical protein COU87_01380 [Candidatus Roizmanbacteria bacterium CG10_big_fil_rev_8_21_14_0_10_39_12]